MCECARLDRRERAGYECMEAHRTYLIDTAYANLSNAGELIAELAQRVYEDIEAQIVGVSYVHPYPAPRSLVLQLAKLMEMRGGHTHAPAGCHIRRIF